MGCLKKGFSLSIEGSKIQNYGTGCNSKYSNLQTYWLATE